MPIPFFETGIKTNEWRVIKGIIALYGRRGYLIFLGPLKVVLTKGQITTTFAVKPFLDLDPGLVQF